MKHIGIIAEYNPFHNGHLYQIKKLRSLYPEKQIIVIMSGNYVQRGEPAVFNKYLRTNCALAAGANLVLELPGIYAVASAEHFAEAALLTLAKTDIVDTLCFGAETDTLSDLSNIADMLVEEPDMYQISLKQYLKEGLSFPKARAYATATYFKNTQMSELLSHPNNILAIEYLKAIKRHHLSITPLLIKRNGSGYHDTSLTGTLSSATAIRNGLETDSITLVNHIPACIHTILQQRMDARPLFISDFYPMLQYKLWEQQDFTIYPDISEELSNRIAKLTSLPASYASLLEQLQCKNLTKTRLSRAFINILLNITKEERSNATIYPSYLSLLGFSKDSSSLLRDIKEHCSLPVINKVTHARKQLEGNALTIYEKALHRDALYRQAFQNKYGLTLKTEQEQSVIIYK